jgi:hypothetical protein
MTGKINTSKLKSVFEKCKVLANCNDADLQFYGELCRKTK